MPTREYLQPVRIKKERPGIRPLPSSLPEALAALKDDYVYLKYWYTSELFLGLYQTQREGN
jgi:hypothetical protein